MSLISSIKKLVSPLLFMVCGVAIGAFALHSCSTNNVHEVTVMEKPWAHADVPPMDLVIHCVTVRPPPMGPDFKVWVHRTLREGYFCDDVKLTVEIKTSAGRTSTRETRLIAGQLVMQVPSDVMSEAPISISVSPEGGQKVSMRVGEPIPGRAMLVYVPLGRHSAVRLP